MRGIDALADQFYQDRILNAEELLAISHESATREKLLRMVNIMLKRKLHYPSCEFSSEREALRYVLDQSGYGEYKKFFEGERDEEISSGSESDDNLSSEYPIPRPLVSPSLWNSRHRKILIAAFNHLSRQVNMGDHDTFAEEVKRIRYSLLGSSCKDLEFILCYLSASSQMLQQKPRACAESVRQGLKVAATTSSPSWCTTAILSSKCWMLSAQNQLESLRTTIDDAISLIEKDSIACAGLASGWIYVDKARLIWSMMSTSNMTRLDSLRRQAEYWLQRAIGQFRMDPSRDGPYGVGVASIMLARTLLCCGNHLQTLKYVPSKEAIKQARNLIQMVEDSELEIPLTLRTQLLIALCDYHLRCGHYSRAEHYANDAHDLALSLRFSPVVLYCDIRLSHIEQAHKETPSLCSKDALSDISLPNSEHETSANFSVASKAEVPVRPKRSIKYSIWTYLTIYLILILSVISFLLDMFSVNMFNLPIFMATSGLMALASVSIAMVYALRTQMSPFYAKKITDD